MNAFPDHFGSLKEFNSDGGKTGSFYSLPGLETACVGPISKLPVSIRFVLESVLRNCGGKKVTEQNIRTLANQQPNAWHPEGISFIVAASRTALHHRTKCNGFVVEKHSEQTETATPIV